MKFLGSLTALAILLVTAGCAGQSVYTINGKKVKMSGTQTITIPKGFSGTISGAGMDVNLNGDEVLNINGRKIRAYSNKIEVNDKPYTVEGDQALVITGSGILIEGAGAAGEGE